MLPSGCRLVPCSIILHAWADRTCRNLGHGTCWTITFAPSPFIASKLILHRSAQHHVLHGLCYAIVHGSVSHRSYTLMEADGRRVGKRSANIAAASCAELVLSARPPQQTSNSKCGLRCFSILLLSPLPLGVRGSTRIVIFRQSFTVGCEEVLGPTLCSSSTCFVDDPSSFATPCLTCLCTTSQLSRMMISYYRLVTRLTWVSCRAQYDSRNHLRNMSLPFIFKLLHSSVFLFYVGGLEGAAARPWHQRVRGGGRQQPRGRTCSMRSTPNRRFEPSICS